MSLLETLPELSTVRRCRVADLTAVLMVTDPTVTDRAAELLTGQLEEVERACGRSRADSELNQVQASLAVSAGRAVTVSPLLAVLIGAALDAAERTGGDLDPTLADDLAALGRTEDQAVYRVPVGAGSIPITLTRRVRPSWREVSLTGRRLRMPAGLRLDLEATARAWAADRAARTISARFGVGVRVTLGGNVAVAGPLSAQDRQVPVGTGTDGVVRPGPGGQAGDPDGTPDLSAWIGLDAAEAGVATVDTGAAAWRYGTRAVHHVLDPSVAQVAPPWRTVSVAAETCLEAAELATAAVLFGEEAPAWLRGQGHPARLVAADGSIVTVNDWPAEHPQASVDGEQVHELTLTRLPQPDITRHAA